jgi:prepilin-type N-terminal cleavage/methylation domain-containing protein
MKRSGFTMIELIFVIVILGILAAVALPKFIGVSEEAHDQKVRAFIGTLNRTVGPALWSASLTANTNGAIVCNDLDNQITPPEELTRDAGACTYSIAANKGATIGVTGFVDGTATVAPIWSE